MLRPDHPVGRATGGVRENGLSIETMKPGDSARVTGLVAGDRGYRQRLLAMGLTPWRRAGSPA